MSVITSELQVAEGLANDFNLDALYYGLLLHRLRPHGTGVRDEFEFLPFIDSRSNPLRLPGVEPDDERIDFERGHGTPLDQRLVRRSAFRLEPSAATGKGIGALQQLYLIVRPKGGASFKAALGLRWVCGPSGSTIVCPPEGLAPVRLWHAPTSQDEKAVQTEPFGGDMADWLGRLGARASQASEQIAKDGLPDGRYPAAPPPAPAPSPNRGIPLRPDVADSKAKAPSLAGLVVEDRTRPASRPPAALVKKGWIVVTGVAFAPVVAYLFLSSAPSPEQAATRSTPTPAGPPSTRASAKPAAPEVSAPLSSLELNRLASAIYVPEGNSNVNRLRLYDAKTGFEDQVSALNRLLESAKHADAASFDEHSIALKAARPPTPKWPSEKGSERRQFNEQLAELINKSVEADNPQTLKRAVDLSERFLSSHFGHSTAHLNLSLALSQLGRYDEAHAQALHAIYTNPDGINGYFALGLSLSGQGRNALAADVFCAALRKARFSAKTVSFFSDVAARRKYQRTPVATAMASAVAQCPAATWAPPEPPLSKP